MGKGTIAPGERIEARCTRCNDVTGHIIVALVEGAIVKVECCACGSVHRYRGASTPRTARATGASGGATARGRAGSGRQAGASERLWREAMERPFLPEARAYVVGMPLALDDVVDHPKYGLGVVRQLIRPDKADILFRDGLHTMRCQC